MGDSPAALAQMDPPLERTARRALGWSFLNNIVGRVGTSLTAIVLARILLPSEYGVYAVALVGLTALLSMNELGVSLAVVRWPGDVSRIAPTVLTIAMGFSGLLWLAAFLAAPAVSRALNAPEASGVLRLLTLGVLIDACTSVSAGLMNRHFMQKRRLVVDTVGFLVVSGVSVSLALAGWGAWALAWGMLLGSLANGVLILWWAPQRYRPGFRRDVVRELLSFGLPLAAASLLLFALLNVDYVVVGATLGPMALGLYLLAFNLSTWPVGMFSAPVRRVSLAGFARIADDRAAACRAFVRALTVLLIVTLPVCLLLATFATPLIGFVYGDKWVKAADALPFLALLALTRILVELAYDFLVALGRSRPNLLIQGVWFAALVPVLILGARWGGILGVAAGHAVVALLVVIPACAVVLRREGVPLRALMARARRPLVGVAIAGACGVAVLNLMTQRFAVLAVGGCLVLAVYAAVVYPMRQLIREGGLVPSQDG